MNRYNLNRNKMTKTKKALLALIFLLIFHSSCFAQKTIAQRIITIAKNEIGNGEIGKNNSGQYVKLYNKGLESSWCAGFISYCLKQSEYNELDYSLSAKAIYNQAKQQNIITASAQAGDLIVFWRDSPKSWKGHIGIVERIDSNYIYTIEGNKGQFPAKVKRVRYAKNNIPKLLGYIKIK